MSAQVLVRFFEFFARDWEEDYLTKVIFNSFNTKKRKNYLISNQNNSTPFGTDFDVIKQKDSLNDLGIQKFYREKNTNNQHYKLKTPYFTDQTVKKAISGLDL